MNVVLLGKPGAGKGSISSLLVDDGFIHMSTGDIFRNEIKLNSELGILADSYISKGELVPDDVTNHIVYHFIKDNLDKNILFDGYPRTVNQAIALDNMCEELGLNDPSVIYLDCKDETIIKRLSSRRVCSSCGEIYNILTLEPKVEGVCDKCNGKLYIRDDDKDESIINRLSVYNNKTKPLIDFYHSRNMLKTFDSDREINDLYRVVKNYIDEINSSSSR